jgi:O-antigen/teichoic acid export membrane protein
MLARLSKISKDTIIYGLGGATSRLAGLVLLPVFTNAFRGPDSYGDWQAVTNFVVLLVLVSVIGLDGAYSIVFFSTDSEVERRRVTTLWVALALFVSVPLTVLLIIGSSWVSQVVQGSPRYADLFAVGVAVLPFSLLQIVVAAILRVHFRARAYAILNVSLSILVFGLGIYFVAVLQMDALGALWATLCATALAAMGGLWAVRRYLEPRLLTGHLWSTTARMLKLGLPLMPASVALWVLGFSNTFFLQHMAGASVTGVFRVGAQIASILGMVLWAFQLAWAPYALSIAREPDAPRVYSRVATLYTAGSVGAAVLLGGAAPIVLLLAKGDYAPASSVIGMLALGSVALGSYYVFAVGVNIAERTGQVGWTTMVAAAANLALNATLIPLWGIVGAGIASVLASLVSAVLLYLVSQRIYPLPYEGAKMSGIWLVGSAAVGIAAAFNVVVHPSALMSAAFTLVLMLGYVVALFLLGAVTPGQLSVGLGAVRSALGKRMGASAVKRAAGERRR